MASVDYANPTVEYRDDVKKPDDYVRICVDIKGLRKQTFGSGASNADVKLELEDRSFSLTVVMKNAKGKSDKYRFKVNRLPSEILTDPKKSFYKVKKDEVVIMLHKASPGSWARQLSNGLDLEPDVS